MAESADGNIELPYNPVSTSTKKTTYPRLQKCVSCDVNPLLELELATTSEGEVLDSTDYEVINNTLTSLESELLKLKHLQMQRYHFEVCIQKKIVPRGLRILKMPTTGNVFPELLCRWQQMNIEVSLNYMKLLNEFFLPEELKQQESIKKRQFELYSGFRDIIVEPLLDRLTDSVCLYEKRLMEQKKHKLSRDLYDFQHGQVFTCSRNNRNVQERFSNFNRNVNRNVPSNVNVNTNSVVFGNQTEKSLDNITYNGCVTNLEGAKSDIYSKTISTELVDITVIKGTHIK